MRVPPDQSGTDRATSAAASLSLRARSSLVTRVSRVEKTNTSTRRCRRADRVGEVQEHARVALHRAADVAQQHDRALARAPRPAWQLDDVAAGAHAARERAPEVHARPVPADPAARPALARRPLEPFHRGAGQRDLVRRELREVLVRERRRVAPGLQDAPMTARRHPSSERHAAGSPETLSAPARLVDRARLMAACSRGLARPPADARARTRRRRGRTSRGRRGDAPAARGTCGTRRRAPRGSRAAAPRRCRGVARRAPPVRALRSSRPKTSRLPRRAAMARGSP